MLILDNGGPKGWARLNKTLTRHKSVLVAFKQKTSTQRNAQQISSVSKIICRFIHSCAFSNLRYRSSDKWARVFGSDARERGVTREKMKRELLPRASSTSRAPLQLASSLGNCYAGYAFSLIQIKGTGVKNPSAKV